MKKRIFSKRFWIIRPVNIALMVLILLLTGVVYYYNKTLTLFILPIDVILIGYSCYKLMKIQKDIYNVVKSASTSIDEQFNNHIINFPIPAAILSADGEIIWYNDVFRDIVLKESGDIFSKYITDVFNISVSQIVSSPGVMVKYLDGYFEAYCFDTGIQDSLQTLYLIDVTALERIALEYDYSRPVIMSLLIDNYEEITRNLNDRERSVMLGEVYRVIDDMLDQTTGFIQRVSSDRYLIMMEKRDADRLKSEQFQVLDKIKEVTTPDNTPITLSIGYSHTTTTLNQAARDSKQALDMALGRGGDQVARKTSSGYEFFGGLSKGIEKRTKVKTRIVANAIVDLIAHSGNVLIMGHRFADLDCFGAAVGLAKACASLGKEVSIVIEPRRNLAQGLINKVIDAGFGHILASPEQGMSMVREDTLLFVVDTHTTALLESVAIYNKAKNVVVIDHHRKLVNYIENALIFYHEPYSSSTCELVTELIQYFGEKCSITSLEAEALMAGIMLDTKNFVIKAGVRTFEAAAYLRRSGADTLSVRRLFANSMETYQRKARVVASAEIYKNCAIAICDFTTNSLRVIAAQSADELLGINEVEASFVIFEENDIVNISARSMGVMNVQLIMEKLGGGGHNTMAAAQIHNSDCDKVRQSLLEVIDLMKK